VSRLLSTTSLTRRRYGAWHSSPVSPRLKVVSTALDGAFEFVSNVLSNGGKVMRNSEDLEITPGACSDGVLERLSKDLALNILPKDVYICFVQERANGGPKIGLSNQDYTVGLKIRVFAYKVTLIHNDPNPDIKFSLAIGVSVFTRCSARERINPKKNIATAVKRLAINPCVQSYATVSEVPSPKDVQYWGMMCDSLNLSGASTYTWSL
jgi:hypothetical protein